MWFNLMIFAQFRKRLDSALQDLEEKQNSNRDAVSTFLTSVDLKPVADICSTPK